MCKNNIDIDKTTEPELTRVTSDILTCDNKNITRHVIGNTNNEFNQKI